MKYTTIRTPYFESEDKTLIFEYIYMDDKLLSCELKGFYYGEPNEEDTKIYYGKLKAEFEGGL